MHSGVCGGCGHRYLLVNVAPRCRCGEDHPYVCPEQAPTVVVRTHKPCGAHRRPRAGTEQDIASARRAS